jgi:ZIP family zinc transporter
LKQLSYLLLFVDLNQRIFCDIYDHDALRSNSLEIIVLDAFIFGLLASSSLLIGGAIGIWTPISTRVLGIIMAFGAGVLISAVSYELVLEAVRLAYKTGAIAIGIFAGAFTFFFADMMISRAGGEGRKEIAGSLQSRLVVPIVLAIVLDGIPETTVIGLSMLKDGSVSIAILIAVFISNLPEAVASTTGMRAGGWGATNILLLWLLIGLICAAAAPIGYALVGDASPFWVALIEAFAAGAILMMLANTMMPEAYEHGGKLAGIFTVLGFFVSALVVLLERAPG